MSELEKRHAVKRNHIYNNGIVIICPYYIFRF